MTKEYFNFNDCHTWLMKINVDTNINKVVWNISSSNFKKFAEKYSDQFFGLNGLIFCQHWFIVDFYNSQKNHLIKCAIAFQNLRFDNHEVNDGDNHW